MEKEDSRKRNQQDVIELLQQCHGILENISKHYVIPDGFLERIDLQVQLLEKEGL